MLQCTAISWGAYAIYEVSRAMEVKIVSWPVKTRTIFEKARSRLSKCNQIKIRTFEKAKTNEVCLGYDIDMEHVSLVRPRPFSMHG